MRATAATGSLPPPVCAAAIVDVREREKKREQDGAALVTHDTRGEGREKVGLFIGLENLKKCMGTSPLKFVE